MARVLLLGANGKLGQMVRYFWPKGSDLVTVARRAPADVVWSIGQSMQDFPSADVVLALWGQTKVEEHNLQENADLAAVAQDIGQQVGARMVVHASTAAVYRPTKTPSKEGDPIDPQNLYGQSKAMMEDVLATPQGPKPIIFRIGNVIGADGLFNAIQTGNTLTLDAFEDGKGPQRSYLTPDFLTHVLWCVSQMMPEDLPTILNLSQRPDLWMKDILHALDHPYTMQPAPKGANQFACLDPSLLYSVLDLSQDTKPMQDLLAPWQEFKKK